MQSLIFISPHSLKTYARGSLRYCHQQSRPFPRERASRFLSRPLWATGWIGIIAVSTEAHAYGAGALTCLAVMGGHTHTVWAPIDVDMPPDIFYRKEIAADGATPDPEAARCMRSSRIVGCGFSAKAGFCLHAVRPTTTTLSLDAMMRTCLKGVSPGGQPTGRGG